MEKTSGSPRKLFAIASTYLKKEPMPAIDLPIGSVKAISEGESIEVDRVTMNLSWAGHSRLKLAYGQGEWYVFNEHWDGLKFPDMRQAIALIREFEGYSGSAYPDPASGDEPWTIGWGTTRYRNGNSVRKGDLITEDEAEEYLEDEVIDIIATLERTIPRWSKLTRNQQSALISFAYNLGAHFYGSEDFDSITRILKSGDFGDAARIFGLYINQGMTGLVRRRKAEADLFLTQEKI